jgi:hypothetical protein
VSSTTTLPTLKKKEKTDDKRREFKTIVLAIIFVKATIKAMTHSITLMCECTNFLARLTFMIVASFGRGSIIF